MLNKINRDILKIVDRYIYQLKINAINEEYKSIFEWDFVKECVKTVDDDYWINYESSMYNHKGLIRINNLPLNSIGYHNNYFDYECGHTKYSSRRINHRIKKAKITYIDIEKFRNYQYTSTKYLHEIKESGIVCLIDN